MARVILSGAKDRPTHASDARGSLAPPTRSFAPLRMTTRGITKSTEAERGHPRIPGQGAARRLRRRDPAGRGGVQPGAGRLPRLRDRRRPLGREGADPLRRAREGRRHQALLQRGRGADGVQGAAGQAARHPSDRPRGPHRPPALRGGGSPHRARDLSRLRARPEERAGDDRRLRAGRHGDRGDLGEVARGDHPLDGRAGGGAHRLPGARDRVRAGARRGPGDPRGDDAARLLPRLPRPRRHHGGDQPARGHDRRPAAGARLQDDLRRQRALPPAQRERAAGTTPRRIRGSRRRRSTGSTTSRSTARSAAS